MYLSEAGLRVQNLTYLYLFPSTQHHTWHTVQNVLNEYMSRAKGGGKKKDRRVRKREKEEKKERERWIAAKVP